MVGYLAWNQEIPGSNPGSLTKKEFATSTWYRKAALLENGYEISAGLVL